MLDEMLKECTCDYFWTEGDPLTLNEFKKISKHKRKSKEEILNDCLLI